MHEPCAWPACVCRSSGVARLQDLWILRGSNDFTLDHLQLTVQQLASQASEPLFFMSAEAKRVTTRATEPWKWLWSVKICHSSASGLPASLFLFFLAMRSPVVPSSITCLVSWPVLSCCLSSPFYTETPLYWWEVVPLCKMPLPTCIYTELKTLQHSFYTGISTTVLNAWSLPWHITCRLDKHRFQNINGWMNHDVLLLVLRI